LHQIERLRLAPERHRDIFRPAPKLPFRRLPLALFNVSQVYFAHAKQLTFGTAGARKKRGYFGAGKRTSVMILRIRTVRLDELFVALPSRKRQLRSRSCSRKSTGMLRKRSCLPREECSRRY